MNQPPPQGPYQGPPHGMPPLGPPPGGSGGQPGGPYGNPYGRPMPQKKTSPWLWVSLGCAGLFVIGIVMVVILIMVLGDIESEDEPGASGGGTSGSSSEDHGLGGGDRSNPDMPGLNEQVEHDGVLFSITDVETGLDEVAGYRAAGEFVVMDVEIEPAGTTSVEFWRDEQHLYTHSGQAIEEHYEATWDYEGINKMGIVVQPGESTTTSIVFDVPDPADISHMGLSTQILGGNEVEVDVTG